MKLINSKIEIELLNLQKEYLELLRRIVDDTVSIESIQIIDSIQIFWESNKKFTSFVLGNFFPAEETSVFTTSAYIDTSNYEHIPFMVLNSYHIWDDPTLNFLKNFEEIENQDFADEMSERIKCLVNDNILILEKYMGKIFVLPVTYILNAKRDDISTIDEIFLKLFKPNYENIKAFFKNNHTIEEVNMNLIEGIENMIMFPDSENKGTKLSDRFRDYIKETTLPTTQLKTESEQFYFVVFGLIIQAYKTMTIIANFKFVPYLRNKTTINYMLILYNILSDDKQAEILQLVNKMFIYYVVHNVICIEKVSSKDINDLINIAHSNDLEKRIFDDSLGQDRNIFHTKLSVIVEIIKNHLEVLY